MFQVYIELLSSPSFWLLSILSLSIALLPDIILIAVRNKQRAQKDPTLKFTSSVSLHFNFESRHCNHGLHYQTVHCVNQSIMQPKEDFLKCFQMLCCIQRRKKWSVRFRTEFNKSTGRISMMRSMKSRVPMDLTQTSTRQETETPDTESTVSLTAVNSEIQGINNK